MKNPNILKYSLNKDIFNLSKKPTIGAIEKTIKEAPSRVYRVNGSPDGVMNVQRWRYANNLVENVVYPQYWALTQVYNEIEIDPTVMTNKEIRKNYVHSREFTVLKNEKEDEKVINFFKSSWFQTFVDETLESIFYGYKLIQIEGIENDSISGIRVAKQQNVNPKVSRLLEVPQNIHSGIDFNNDEEFSEWLIFISPSTYDKHYYGLYNVLAPIVLNRRAAQNAMSDYVDRFGSPNLVYKSPVMDDNKRFQTHQFLSEYNNLSYAIVPDTDELTITESTGKSAEVYLEAIKYLETSISKVILGSDISSEKSFVGSANIHEGIVNDYSLADIKFVENVINNQLIPKMIKLGLNFLNGVKFKYLTQPKPNEDTLFNQVISLIQNGYEIEDDYITATFGIPVKKKIEEVINKNNLETDV